jgi:hypothetical protein
MASTTLNLGLDLEADLRYAIKNNSDQRLAQIASSQLGVDYNAAMLETIAREIAPVLGWSVAPR